VTKIVARTLHELRQAYPESIGRNLPLVIGVHKQIQGPWDPLVISRALGIHTRTISYLQNAIRKKTRYHLDGTPAGSITEEELGRFHEMLGSIASEAREHNQKMVEPIIRKMRKKKKYAELSDEELFPIAWRKYRSRLERQRAAKEKAQK
jgi:sRNA-binding protein